MNCDAVNFLNFREELSRNCRRKFVSVPEVVLRTRSGPRSPLSAAITGRVQSHKWTVTNSPAAAAVTASLTQRILGKTTQVHRLLYRASRCSIYTDQYEYVYAFNLYTLCVRMLMYYICTPINALMYYEFVRVLQTFMFNIHIVCVCARARMCVCLWILPMVQLIKQVFERCSCESAIFELPSNTSACMPPYSRVTAFFCACLLCSPSACFIAEFVWRVFCKLVRRPMWHVLSCLLPCL